MSFAGELGKEGIKAEAAVLDVADADAVAAAFAKSAASLGPVDILVNNAGFSGVPTLSVTVAGRLEPARQGQPQRRLLLRPRRAPGDEVARGRRHHQHRLGQRVVGAWRLRL